MTATEKIDWFLRTRRQNRQRRSRHLHECGPRCILEALLAVDRGATVDAVLEDFGRLPPELYHATLYYYGGGDDEVEQ